MCLFYYGTIFILHSFFIIIIEDGCLEDGIIIVEDVDAERTRCEE